MEISGKTLRTLERGVHLALGALLLVVTFTPLGQGAVGDVLRLAAAPLVVITGLMMWQHARVVRALREPNAPLRIR